MTLGGWMVVGVLSAAIAIWIISAVVTFLEVRRRWRALDPDDDYENTRERD
jgi:hypothetical protein